MLTINFSTHFYLQNEISKNEFNQKVFKGVNHKDGAKYKYEVFRKAPRTFRILASGAGWGRERGGN